MKLLFKAMFASLGLLSIARRTVEFFNRSRHRHANEQICEVRKLETALGERIKESFSSLPENENALIFGTTHISHVIVQLPILTGLRLAGYVPIVLLSNRSRWIERGYRSLGCSEFVYLEDHLENGPNEKAIEAVEGVSRIKDLLELEYLGARSGRFALSTLMRTMRVGDPDLQDEAVRNLLKQHLSSSFNAVEAAGRIIEITRPSLGLFNERGYTPFGEVFDAVLKGGGECILWCAAHKDGFLILKRFNRTNVEQNHFSLSDESWNKIKSMPWVSGHWSRLRSEIEGCYRSGQWFSEVGTQFDKTFPNKSDLISSLGLDPDKKTAVIFAHIFWDATFFWGEDLFDNYEDWLIHMVKAAAKNPHLNWLVKIHPGNTVKDHRDGYTGENPEVVAIRSTLGDTQTNVRVIPPESEISTLSLFDIMNYCVTVRGSIGMESACRGIPVITAGTGRFDQRGFTIDSNSREECLSLISRLHEIEPMTTEQTELARRFTYGVFVVRPLKLESVDYGFRRNETADLFAKVSPGLETDIGSKPDVVLITDWIQSGREDYLDQSELEVSIQTGSLEIP